MHMRQTALRTCVSRFEKLTPQSRHLLTLFEKRRARTTFFRRTMIKDCVVATLLCLGCLFPCDGNAGAQTFKKYSNPVFVETGTYVGDGVQMALDAGFSSVYSIELSPQLYTRARQRFIDNPHVKIFQGDFETMLFHVIKDIHQPITFWLDGHYSGGPTTHGAKNTAVLEELEQIKRHPIKTHTILIDDMRCCETWWFDGISKQQIIDKVKEINPNYEISYEDGFAPNDILVAQIPNK